MGEVSKSDTRLDRDVAIKVLAETFASDAERRPAAPSRGLTLSDWAGSPRCLLLLRLLRGFDEPLGERYGS